MNYSMNGDRAKLRSLALFLVIAYSFFGVKAEAARERVGRFEIVFLESKRLEFTQFRDQILPELDRINRLAAKSQLGLGSEKITVLLKSCDRTKTYRAKIEELFGQAFLAQQIELMKYFQSGPPLREAYGKLMDFSEKYPAVVRPGGGKLASKLLGGKVSSHDLISLGKEAEMEFLEKLDSNDCPTAGGSLASLFFDSGLIQLTDQPPRKRRGVVKPDYLERDVVAHEFIHILTYAEIFRNLNESLLNTSRDAFKAVTAWDRFKEMIADLIPALIFNDPCHGHIYGTDQKTLIGCARDLMSPEYPTLLKGVESSGHKSFGAISKLVFSLRKNVDPDQLIQEVFDSLKATLMHSFKREEIIDSMKAKYGNISTLSDDQVFDLAIARIFLRDLCQKYAEKSSLCSLNAIAAVEGVIP